MNMDKHLQFQRVAYNKEVFTLPYDNTFTSKLQSLSWKDGAEQEIFSDNCLLVWPPRCYSCNFCDREFRSAQALGGHMNVHRRDRARLQQGFPHLDLNEGHTNCNASTLEGSDSSSIHGLKRPCISPRVCALSPDPTVISENCAGHLITDPTIDDRAITSGKRRRANTLIEAQHIDVDLELRL